MKFSLLILALLMSVHHLCAAPIVEKIIDHNREAYRLSDGQTQAIVVPDYSGRVMFYGKVGGANWLWNAPAEKLGGEGFQNYGGDKTFVGPHGLWSLFAKSLWPPQPSWDGRPHTAEVLPGGRLRTVGPMWDGFGARIIREYSFDTDGAFVIRQTIEKVRGGALPMSIWSVSQAAPPDAIYIPLNPQSPYKNGFHWFGQPKENAALEVLSPSLLQVKPTTGVSYKIGADSPVSAIAVVKNDVAWLQRAPKPKGQFPDGAEGAGFPVEFYNHGDKGAGQYVELELLSPLRPFAKGARWTHTVRWSLHRLPGKDVNAPATHTAIAELLRSEFGK